MHACKLACKIWNSIVADFQHLNSLTRFTNRQFLICRGHGTEGGSVYGQAIEQYGQQTGMANCCLHVPPCSWETRCQCVVMQALQKPRAFISRRGQSFSSTGTVLASMPPAGGPQPSPAGIPETRGMCQCLACTGATSQLGWRAMCCSFAQLAHCDASLSPSQGVQASVMGKSCFVTS